MEPTMYHVSSDCCCFLGLFDWLFFFVCFCWGSGSSLWLCLWPMWGIYISFNALNRCCSLCNNVEFEYIGICSMVQGTIQPVLRWYVVVAVPLQV